MIIYNYETDFELVNSDKYSEWIENSIESEGYEAGEISYVFCDDEYLHKINVEYLQHDTLTDIISFDYTMGQLVSGDIFISIERVKDNAKDHEVDFETELLRVMIHGIMHYCGYKDKSPEDAKLMRKMEEKYMKEF